MDRNRTIRKAKEEEIPQILQLYEQARYFMEQQGNPAQWTNGYPGIEDVQEDFRQGNLYVCIIDDQVEAAFMFALGEEPTYSRIENGAWLNEEPYGYLHRIASAGKVKGTADFCLDWCFARCGNMRGDTHEKNKIMQHVFDKNGFRECGTIFVEDGTPRIAYQKEGYRMETDRLYLRNLTSGDYDNLCMILRDKEVMYAYEHGFSQEEVQNWLQKQIGNYEKHGYGLFAVIEKKSGEFIGQCGITPQDVGDKQVPEVGYLFRKDFWHQGFALEAASACKKFAFEVLGEQEVYSIIRDNNYASQNVAKRNHMTVNGSFVKHYYGIDMPHLVYRVTKEEDENGTSR